MVFQFETEDIVYDDGKTFVWYYQADSIEKVNEYLQEIYDGFIEDGYFVKVLPVEDPLIERYNKDIVSHISPKYTDGLLVIISQRGPMVFYWRGANLAMIIPYKP
jgi:hypothetical protein